MSDPEPRWVALTWDGVTRAATIKPELAARRHRLADAARAYRWSEMLALLTEAPGLINTVRPDGRSWFTPLHQAAHGNAPPEIVETLIRYGAWCSLPTAAGRLAVDIARARGHIGLVPRLVPRYEVNVPATRLDVITAHFHSLINVRAARFVERHMLRLPVLTPLLERAGSRMWFAIPGMYGGFRFWFEGVGNEATLISESWSRVVGGSGQRHRIDESGPVLVEEGFV